MVQKILEIHGERPEAIPFPSETYFTQTVLYMSALFSDNRGLNKLLL